MTERNASRTALGAAYLRAAHQLFDARPLALEDPFALTILGPSAPERLASTKAEYFTPQRLELRAHMALRARYAEDRLELAVARGVGQYVLLGAGFDTFLLRQPGWARGLRIFEVDHPGAQEAKRRMLAASGLAAPPNVTFAAVDFERETLAQGLRRHGVSPEIPTFFSCLGVTMYLNAEAVDALFACAASFPKGSEIVLTYATPEDRDSPLAQRTQSLGEPWVSFFSPEEIEAKLLGAGFSRVAFVTAAQAAERYFTTPGGLPAPRRTNLLSAVL